MAWMIGWILILEYIVAYIAVVSAWSGYFMHFLSGFSGVLPVIFMLSSVAREVQGGLLSEAKFDMASWGLLSLVPVLAVVLSTLTAYWTVQRTLRRML